MTKREQAFIKLVWDYYRKHGRRHLPWRQTRDPYRIVVSEIMLQQTQVDRVLPKYDVFIDAFPTTKKLAQARLGSVLRLWQGLGYNRRAQNLHKLAGVVETERGGAFPKEYGELVTLPGIGPYTAGAVMAFAYGKPMPIIETNIRTAYIYHFHHNRTDVTDAELLKLIEKTMDTKKPREWFSALMDYGSYIKKSYGNPNSKSRHYTKQSAFNGSDRQIRGAIIRTLLEDSSTRKELHTKLTFDHQRIDEQLEKLEMEGMIKKEFGFYAVPE